jgi:hypothetical protein
MAGLRTITQRCLKVKTTGAFIGVLDRAAELRLWVELGGKRFKIQTGPYIKNNSSMEHLERVRIVELKRLTPAAAVERLAKAPVITTHFGHDKHHITLMPDDAPFEYTNSVLDQRKQILQDGFDKAEAMLNYVSEQMQAKHNIRMSF